MEKFTNVSGVAAPMPLVNIDTDMIIPKQFLKTIKRSGLGVNLFDEMRYNQDGTEISDFVLNQSAYRNAEIIIAGENFGCGSSREHAPWALKDFGISVVISESFADIFYNNCFKNGILPIRLDQEKIDVLMSQANNKMQLTINLDEQKIISEDESSIKFEIDLFRKKCLLEGLDDIALTLQKKEKISQFEENIKTTHPWII